MNRVKNYSRSLATSRLQLDVHVVYSPVSGPLALCCLPRAKFGCVLSRQVWARKAAPEDLPR
jgi:hypothetical protein